MTGTLRIFGAPGRYIQGAGALAAMGETLRGVGSRTVLVADRAVLGLFGEAIVSACSGAGIRCEPLEFSGEITPEEVARLATLARHASPDFVIGCGGGRGVDAGKAVADALKCRVATIPTAASNDAPTSKIYVLYDSSHRLLRVGHMSSSPEVVVVDTEIVVTAPESLFTAGIGDAVVKKFEVAQCVASGGRNIFGASACRAAVALTELCYETLRKDAVAALAAVRQRRVTDEVERVVEATVLHSGLGFESGGLSISHAMTRGLSAVRGTRDALHGHQVAYALLVQLALERRSRAFVDDVLAFYAQVGLPASLGDIGLPDATAGEVDAIAAGTMTAPHARHFERELEARDIADAMRAVEAHGAR
ncbi:MAG: iron-containing alcohol dehydrogenase [Betaproteobacteria bacterium]|nr:iron-containing alcohol dehydrogenase [Betaproteobacteria bacterium]